MISGKNLYSLRWPRFPTHLFRIISKENGAGLTFTQMVSASGVINNNFDTLRYLSFSRDEKPIGVQILGNDPGIISEAITEIKSLSLILLILTADVRLIRYYAMIWDLLF